MALVLTTAIDLEKRYSADGVSLRTDDDYTSIEDCIAEATALVVSYLQPRYPDTELYSSVPTLRFMARAFALYFLCSRRGETPTEQMQKDFDRYMKMLEGFAEGRPAIFGAASVPGGPGFSNQDTDLQRNPVLGVSGPRSQDLYNPDHREQGRPNPPQFGGPGI